MNQDRLARLATPGGVLRKNADGYLPKGAEKLGKGPGSVVVGPEILESHLDHPTDPGFVFTPRGSLLRQGPRLDLAGGYQTLFFREGGEQLNPLGHVKASSTTDPLPTIVPSLRPGLLALVAGDFQKLLGALRRFPI